MSDEHNGPDDAVDAPATSETDASGTTPPAATAVPVGRTKRARTSPRVFLREVRSELRKVAWPSRKELFSYSLVVLVSVSIITAYIAGLDQLFGTLILRIFSS